MIMHFVVDRSKFYQITYSLSGNVRKFQRAAKVLFFQILCSLSMSIYTMHTVLAKPSIIHNPHRKVQVLHSCHRWPEDIQHDEVALHDM